MGPERLKWLGRYTSIERVKLSNAARLNVVCDPQSKYKLRHLGGRPRAGELS